MKLAISAALDLSNSDGGSYVTWFEARAGEVAEARVAVVHVGEIADAEGDLWPAMRNARLESVHDAYFEGGWYKDEYADGAGIDLLLVDRIEIDAASRAKNVDLAIVRRLCDSIGSSCQIVVVRYESAHEAAHWARLGFVSSTPGRTRGLMHMKLGERHARVVDATGSGEFEVLAAGGATNDWLGESAIRRRACN